QVYDQFGPDGPQAGFGGGGFGGFSGFEGGGFGGFEDIFSTFFGGGMGGSTRNGPIPGDDIVYDLTISFEEAAKGCEKEINLVRDEECPTCGGSGAKPGSKIDTCPNCHGSGQERVVSNTPFGRIQNVRTCSRCGGTGKIITEPCTKCHGRGKVRVSRRRTIKVPAGIDNGQILNIRGEGALGERGGPPGDLKVVVNVRPHKLFKRRDDNLYIEMPLTFTQAALGAELDVPTLEKPVKYKFPEGTQPGQMFTIKGQGVTHLRGGGKGDLYITAVVEIPKKLTNQQKELLRQFDGLATNNQYEKKKSFMDRLRDVFS
ncbi:MAG: DnaJ C-terminal domain-containing protein, partial [bacterium]